jgi:hypothetical protein
MEDYLNKEGICLGFRYQKYWLYMQEYERHSLILKFLIFKDL